MPRKEPGMEGPRRPGGVTLGHLLTLGSQVLCCAGKEGAKLLWFLPDCVALQPRSARRHSAVAILSSTAPVHVFRSHFHCPRPPPPVSGAAQMLCTLSPL